MWRQPCLDTDRICRMGGGGGGGGSQTSTTETVVPDWVQAQIQQNLGTANQLSAQPYTPYTGPTTAGFTPDQLASFQAVEQMQGVAPGQIGSAYSSVANLPGSIASLANPALAGAETTAYQQATRGLALTDQTIGAQAASQGALGGTREGVALGAAESGAQAGLGTTVNNLATNSWLQATQGALQGATLQGNLATAGQTAGLLGAGALGTVGQEQQTQQQAAYSQALQQWQAAQNYPYQQLALNQSALAGSPYGTSVTGSQPYSSNTLAQGLGAAAAAIPAIANLPGAASTLSNFGSSIGGLFGASAPAFTSAAVVPVTATALPDLTAAGAGAAAATDAAATGAAAAGGASKGAADALPAIAAVAA
jgi:hypothetical protein